MRRVIGFVILAAIVIAIAWWVAGLPGQIAATISGTQIQTSVPVALLLLLVLFVILYVIVRLLGGLWRTPRRIRRRRRERHRRAGDRAVTRTLIALAAGEAGNARREAGRARRLLGDTPQTLLLAAEAARRAGRAEEAAADYRLLAAREDAAFLGLHGLMRQAIAREDWAGATELAQQAERAHPASDWLRSERAQLAIRAGKWREALEVSPLDASHAGARAALAAAAADAAPDTESGRRLGKQAFDMDPKLVPAALAYARRLREGGREGRAQDVLRRAWIANPHPDLAEFALAPAADPLGRVRAATALTRDNPSQAESQLLLARVSLAAGLTGEARRHAEAARAAGLTQRRVWTLLADIADAEGNAEASREALRHAAVAEPDPTWRCDACGTELARWTPICPHCHAATRVGWSVPVRTITAA